MPNAAYRRRVQALATGAIAVVAAASQAVPAQADDTQNTSHNAKTLNNAHPAWATADKDRGAVPASQTITTRVFLTGQDQAGLAALAKSVNDPNSPDYGRFLTPEQVKEQFGATPAQIAAVQKWLQESGLTVSAVNSNWIDAHGTPQAVQRAFGTELKNYQRPDGSVGYAASSAAVIPGSVANLVAGVSGLSQVSTMAHTNSVGTRQKPGTSNTAGAKTGGNSTAGNGTDATGPMPADGCGPNWGAQSVSGFPAGSNGANIPIAPCAYGPNQLRQAYGQTNTGKGATIAVVDWFASNTMEADANAWSADVGVPQFRPGQYREVVANPDTASKCADPRGEEALDVEMAHGLAPDANVVYVGAASCNDDDLMAAEQKIVDGHLADIVSNSWGALIHTTGGDMDPAVMEQYDRIFQQGAAEGISFTFSTGDCGDDDPAWKAAGGANCSANSARKQTEWPVSSQWVTAVGGTTLATSNAGGSYAWEVAMGDHAGSAFPGDKSWSPVEGTKSAFQFYFGGGGGTSEDVSQPWYQAGKVPAGLANTQVDGAPATRPMRVLPDVAMNGSLATAVDIAYTDADGFNHWNEGGTSVAAPEFAAVLANVKQAAGHGFGLVNPSLYALNANAYHDVTSRPGVTEAIRGRGDGSAWLWQVGEDTSLNAAPGYDNATGLGSPNGNFVAALAAQKAPDTPATTVSRLAGDDRYLTAIAVSKKAFPADHTAANVVLATGDNFPDALAGVPLSKQLNAPLLLTPGTALDPRVAAEIHRVLAPGGKVYVLGGEKAVSSAVVNALKLPNVRISGNDRYETSVAIAKAMGSPTNVVLATGSKFPDALAAGPFASDQFTSDTHPAAILLTADATLPKPVFSYMDNHVTEVASIGHQATDAIAGFPGLRSFAGADRYETAAKVAAAFAHSSQAGVATGLKFADALTGAALLARQDAPLLLTDPGGLSQPSQVALQGLAHALAGGGSVEVFGGKAAVPDAVVNQIARAVGGRAIL